MRPQQRLSPLPTLAFSGGSLRPWHLDDAPRLVQAWADPDIAKWNSVPPEPTIATAERWVSGQAQRLQMGLSLDAVIETPLGVVGEVGLSGFSEKHKGALLGYWLLPQARGQGIAAAAVQAFAQWAHRALDLDVIAARCDPANAASQAVVERSGFVLGANDPAGNQIWRSRPRVA